MLAKSSWMVIVFVAINLLLNTWFLDNGRNDNSMSRAAMVAALVHHGTFRIDQYQEGIGDKALIEGHYYSEKAPLPALIVAPAYWILESAGFMESSEKTINADLLQLGGFICGSMAFVLILLLCWQTTRRAALLCALPFYASFLFVYSGSFYNHLIAAAFAFSALLLVERNKPLLAGFLAGAAFLSEYTLLLVPLIWMGQHLLQLQWKELGKMALGLLPAILLCLLYNYTITGEATTFPYHYHASFGQMADSYAFGWPTFSSFYGLSFSPYRGLFFYAPVLLLLFFSFTWPKNMMYAAKGMVLDPLIFPAIALFFLMTMYGIWGGGWTYGPRFLTATTVFLFYFLLKRSGPLKHKYWFYTLVLFGLACAFIAKATRWYDLPTEVDKPFIDLLIPALLNGEWTERLGLGGLVGISNESSILVFVFLFVLAALLAIKVEDPKMG